MFGYRSSSGKEVGSGASEVSLVEDGVRSSVLVGASELVSELVGDIRSSEVVVLVNDGESVVEASVEVVSKAVDDEGSADDSVLTLVVSSASEVAEEAIVSAAEMLVVLAVNVVASVAVVIRSGEEVVD